MISSVLSRQASAPLAMLGLAIFLCLFLGVIWWVTRKDSGALYQRLERLPLDEK